MDKSIKKEKQGIVKKHFESFGGETPDRQILYGFTNNSI